MENSPPAESEAPLPVIASEREETSVPARTRRTPWRRLLAHGVMVLLLAIAAYLRLAGAYWGDQGMHPDERGIYMRIDHMKVVPADTSGVSRLGALLRLVDVNLRAGAWNAQIEGDQEDLNPEHFAYGSLLYTAAYAASLLVDHVHANAAAWGKLGWAIAGVALLVGLAPFLARRAGRTWPLALASFAPRAALSLGALSALVFLLREGADLAFTAAPPHPSVFRYWGSWFVARPLSGLCGALTVLVLYRIGCRFFDAGTGLLAAAFLSFTVLHVQLGHYYASDTMLALWAALAVLYCGYVATRARFGDFIWAGIFIGAAIATKFSAVLLPPLYALAFLLSWYAPQRDRILERLLGFVAGGAVAALTVLWAQPFAWVESGLPTAAAAVPGTAYELVSLGELTVVLLIVCGIAAVVRVATTGGPVAFFAAALIPAVLVPVRGASGWLLAAAGVAGVLRRFGILPWRGRIAVARPRWLTAVAALSAVLFVIGVLSTGKALREAQGMPAVFGSSALGVAFSPERYPYLGSTQFRHDTHEQSVMAQGGVFVWTIQYEHTPPVAYQIRNLVQLSMGPPLALLCLGGFAWLVGRSLTTWHRPSVLIVAWILANVLVVGSFQTKFARYMAPYLPFLCFAAAALVARFVWGKEPAPARWRWIVGLGAAVALGYSALYAWSFVQTIYLEPHTKHRASRWIYDNVPPGTTIVGEHWDDPVPIGLPGRSPQEYPHVQLPIYDDDFPRLSEKDWDTNAPNLRKYGIIAESLERGQYVALASRKLYGSVMRQEDKRYKLASQFYKLLFAGRLGFTHVATFTNPPRILGIPIDEDTGEESFSIYDHPKICIFKKTRPLDREAYLALLTSPAPADVASLTMDEILRAEAGRPIWQRKERFAPIRYWLVLELLTLLAVPYVFRACGGSADRGLLLAKPVGVLLLAYGAWLLGATRVMAYGPASIGVVLCLLAAGAAVIVIRHHAALQAHLRACWPVLLAAELAFGAVFGIFLYVRRMNPDVRWSEKLMDFSFLSAAYRTDFFPLKDPWISGFDVNYYYWGHVLYATLGRLADVPPAYAYNLACAAAPALAFTAALAVGYALTRRLRYGLLAAFLAVFAGNLIGYLQLARNLDREAFPPDAKVPAAAAAYVDAAPAVMSAAWGTLRSLDDGVLPENVPRAALGFDSYFWRTGHYVDDNNYGDLIRGVVANEFPMWTYLHADLHAHLIVMAFSMTFVGLLASLFLARGNGGRLFGPGTSWVMGAGLLALAFGALSCINTWDVPTGALLLGSTLAFKAYAHRHVATAERRGAVRVLATLGVTAPRLVRLHLLARYVAVDVLAPLVVIAGLAYLLFWPFHTHFVPRATSVRLTDMSFTTIETFLKIFGFFALVFVPFLLLAVVRWARHTPRGRLAAIAAGFFVLAGAALYPSWSTGEVGSVVRAAWWSLPLQREVGGPELFRPQWGLLVALLPLLLVTALLLLRKSWTPSVRFAMILIAAGLGVICGCELVYMFEAWGGDKQRWNTPFKFYLQAWWLFALAVPVLWRAVWTARIAALARVGRALWATAVVAVFAAVAVFPVFGAYAVIWGEGARSAVGPRPSLDGLAYLDHEAGGALFAGDREGIAWFARMVPGNRAVVMEAAPGYYNELGRWGAFTGVPSVLGWDHHVGERGHVTEKAPRMLDVQRFYQSPDRQECLAVLRKYGVDYVIVGELERSRWLHAGQPFPTNTDKFRQWGDVLEPVFDSSSIESAGLQIYRVRRDRLL